MKNTVVIFVLCVAALLLGLFLFFYNPKDLTGNGAKTDQSAQVATAPVTETAVSFTVVDSGSFAQEVNERKNVAVRDEAALARLWKMVHGDQEIAPPTLDFSKEYMIGVFAGEKSTGGYMIEVMNMTDLGDMRTLSITLTVPGENCAVSQAFTSPYQLIRVPVNMHYLKAIDTTVTSDCD